MENILFLYKEMLGGGAEKVIFDVAKKFNENQHYNVILATENSIDINLYKEANLNLYDVKFSKVTLRYILINLRKMIEICKKNNVKIIHSHHRLTTVYAQIVGKLLNIKVVHTEHNVFPDKNWINLRGKNIIAVSENVKQTLIQNGVNKKYIKVIYNGINLDHRDEYIDLKSEYGISSKRFSFGVIARLSKQKGIFYLLSAFKEIVKENTDIVLFIIGDGELKEEISKYIHENNLDKNVIITGKRNDILKIIPSLDCYVLPSIYEGFPVTNLEIMSKERIVIATKVGGNEEIIKDGMNGFLVKAKDVKQLQSKLTYVLQNKDNLTEMNIMARKTIEEKFNLDDIYNKYLNFYNKVINE
ncbi:MAG: glycosyltransferase family 4 protein [Clostridium sp.]|nr:glycosyltransferase family 4 protein [Clostridium sp.]